MNIILNHKHDAERSRCGEFKKYDVRLTDAKRAERGE